MVQIFIRLVFLLISLMLSLPFNVFFIVMLNTLPVRRVSFRLPVISFSLFLKILVFNFFH